MTEAPLAPDSVSNKHWKTYIARGLHRKCPRCGDGALFIARTKLAQQCEVCSLVYRREQGAMTGQLYLAAVITQIFAAVMIGIIFVFTDWNPSFSIPFGLTVLAVFVYWLLPKTIALWVCIEFMTDVGNRETWVLERDSNSNSDA